MLLQPTPACAGDEPRQAIAAPAAAKAAAISAMAVSSALLPGGTGSWREWDRRAGGRAGWRAGLATRSDPAALAGAEGGAQAAALGALPALRRAAPPAPSAPPAPPAPPAPLAPLAPLAPHAVFAALFTGAVTGGTVDLGAAAAGREARARRPGGSQA